MAEIALIDLGIFHARHTHRYHSEVLHIVAGRSLMALRAIERFRRGMAKPGHFPCHGDVALRTLLTEQSLMTIFGGVTSGAIERGLEGGGPGREWRRRTHPISKALSDTPPLAV